MKKSTVIPIIVGILVIIYFLLQVEPEEFINIVSNFKIRYVILTILLGFIAMLLATTRWDLLNREFHSNIAFLDLFMYRILGFGGLIALYSSPFISKWLEMEMKHEEHIIKKSVEVGILDRAIETVILVTVTMIFTLIFATPPIKLAVVWLMLIFIILFLAALSFIYYLEKTKFSVHNKNGGIKNIIKTMKLIKGKVINVKNKFLYLIKKKPQLMVYALLITLVQIICMVLFFSIIIYMVFNNSFIGSIKLAFLPYLFLIIGSFIPIPLGIGNLDAIEVFAFSLLGMGVGMGLFATLMIRIKDITMGLIVGALIISKGMRKEKEWVVIKG